MSAPPGSRRVIVVGAGFAGLAAADALATAGYEVLVLEARDRVGGRVHSRALDDGSVIELGAEFILPGCTLIRELADRYRLGLWDKGMRYGNREPRGVELDAGELEQAAELIDRALARLPAGSAADLLDSLPISPAAREAVRARCEVSAAASAGLVPAGELGGLARISDDPAPGIAGGNQRLADALAAGLGEGISLSAPASGLRWGPDGVSVRTAGGEAAGAACVIAVPAPVLDRIDFEPPLPQGHRAAFGAIAYGHAAKLFVPLRSPAAPSATISVPERYWAWVATGRDEQPQPLVSGFAGSTAALERLEVEAGPGRWLDSLERLRPDLDLDRGRAMLATWDDDPWAGAAYSLAPPAAVRELLSEPLGPLAFAGEHLAGEYGSLMEGALRSGRRAADRIAATLASGVPRA